MTSMPLQLLPIVYTLDWESYSCPPCRFRRGGTTFREKRHAHPLTDVLRHERSEAARTRIAPERRELWVDSKPACREIVGDSEQGL
jgi:hypothetical protein